MTGVRFLKIYRGSVELKSLGNIVLDGRVYIYIDLV